MDIRKETVKERQRQGIEAARAQGKHLGRPKAEYPDAWENVYRAWKSGEITTKKAVATLDMKRSTFYKLAKQHEEKEIKMSNENKIMPAPNVVKQAVYEKMLQLNKDIKSYEEPLKRLKEQKAELLKWCKGNGMTILDEQ